MASSRSETLRASCTLDMGPSNRLIDIDTRSLSDTSIDYVNGRSTVCRHDQAGPRPSPKPSAALRSPTAALSEAEAIALADALRGARVTPYAFAFSRSWRARARSAAATSRARWARASRRSRITPGCSPKPGSSWGRAGPLDVVARRPRRDPPIAGITGWWWWIDRHQPTNAAADVRRRSTGRRRVRQPTISMYPSAPWTRMLARL